MIDPRRVLLPFRRAPRDVIVDVTACRATVAASLPPSFSLWTSKDPHIARALDAARAKWSSGADIELTPLADAVMSLAVAWAAMTAGWQLEGPGATEAHCENVARLIDLWVAERGLGYALEALAAALDLDQIIHPPAIERATRQSSNGSRLPARWRRLRERVAAASEDDYAAVRASALRLRATATPAVRFLTSFVFPWEEAWARADATLSGAVPLALIGTALDASTCAALMRDSRFDVGEVFEDGRFATMVEILGDAAEEPVLAALETWSGDVSAAASVAVRFATPKVAEAMRAVLRRPEAPIARAFFRRNPKLALEALIGERGADAKALVVCAVAREHEAACELAKRTRTKAHKKLLAELGAASTWVAARAPARVVDAAAPWKEVSAWVAAGAPWSGRAALGAIADSDSLVAFVKAVARDAMPIALAAIDVLATRQDAIQRLGRLADAAVRPEIAEYCRAHLEDLQAKAQLTDDDVEDLVAPSFAHGMLDYGERKFVARFDEDFKPVLYDVAGERVRSLPRATKNDDARRAEHAAELWEAMSSAPEEAKAQARRMEAAMEADRAFSDAIFRERVVPHPVLGALARRLLWRDGAGVLFRIEDDGSFADVDDAPVTVRPPFRIARAETLGEVEHARWADLFASYKILQPFKQL